MALHKKRAQRERVETGRIASTRSSDGQADAHAPGMHQPRRRLDGDGMSKAAGRVRYAGNSPHIDRAAGEEFVQQQARPSSDSADT